MLCRIPHLRIEYREYSDPARLLPQMKILALRRPCGLFTAGTRRAGAISIVGCRAFAFNFSSMGRIAFVARTKELYLSGRGPPEFQLLPDLLQRNGVGLNNGQRLLHLITYELFKRKLAWTSVLEPKRRWSKLLWSSHPKRSSPNPVVTQKAAVCSIFARPFQIGHVQGKFLSN